MSFRDGNLVVGEPLGMTTQNVTLSADNTRIDASRTSLLLLTSDNTTATSRTFLLDASPLVGHRLVVHLISAGSTTCELADSGTCQLSAAWTPLQYDSITLVSNGVYWLEECRSMAAALPNVALTSAHILVGNGSNLATDVAVTGDVTIGNTGVTAIGASKVVKAMLAATVRPAYMVVLAGTFTTAGGDANESITATGAIVGDLAFCQLKTVGTGSRTILSATATTDAITIVMSGDPTTDHVICWQVLRATT